MKGKSTRRKKDGFLNPPRDENVHYVYHKFVDKFMVVGKWKFKGYDLIIAVERWALKYPSDVIVTYCDDSYHASSLLVFIKHQAIKHPYWGTTMVYIPQCTGENPIEIFLYPTHATNLRACLAKLRKSNKNA